MVRDLRLTTPAGRLAQMMRTSTTDAINIRTATHTRTQRQTRRGEREGEIQEERGRVHGLGSTCSAVFKALVINAVWQRRRKQTPTAGHTSRFSSSAPVVHTNGDASSIF